MPDRSGPGAARPFARKRIWTKRLGDAGAEDKEDKADKDNP